MSGVACPLVVPKANARNTKTTLISNLLIFISSSLKI